MQHPSHVSCINGGTIHWLQRRLLSSQQHDQHHFAVAPGAGFGMMLQSKLLVWAGLFTAMAGYTHMPFEAPDAVRMMMLVFT